MILQKKKRCLLPRLFRDVGVPTSSAVLTPAEGAVRFLGSIGDPVIVGGH